MKLSHAAALALVVWYLMVPSGIHAQSQLNIPPPPVVTAEPAAPAAAPHGNNTLEIPVVVQPNQPPLDPTFVGDWCGPYQLTSADQPVAAALREGLICFRFRRSGDGIVIQSRVHDNGGSTAQLGVSAHVVSDSAEAVGPGEIIATDVVEMISPPARATATLVYDLKLIAPGKMELTRTNRVAVTDLNYVPFSASTVRWIGKLHLAQSGEFEAWQISRSNDSEIGGGDVAVPGAK